MMIRMILLTFILALSGPAALAQGCGSGNPNCIVTTMPPGDNSNRAASDAFVQQAITNVPGSTPGGTNGQVQYNNGGLFGGLTNAQLTALVNPFTSLLPGAVPASGGGTTAFLRADGTFAIPPGTAGSTNAFLIGSLTTPAGGL
jgi:hypothetical protein